MKQLKNLFVALALYAPLTAAAQDIAINEENFPDENFRNYLLGQDYGADGVITEEEINGIVLIDVQGKNIGSLQGIEHFTALENLFCRANRLTALDVSNNTALTSLSCGNNPLTALDVSNNTALTFLYCDDNQLTALDVSNNTALTSLLCPDNQLTALDVSNNTALETLLCHFNQLDTLDVSQLTELRNLACNSTRLKSLDLSNNTALITLDAGSCLLESLNVSQNTALTTLYCSRNRLASLDVTQNTALTLLDITENQLETVDVSQNTELRTLFCEAMPTFTSLDLSQNTQLSQLWCTGTGLETLDLSNNTALVEAYCNNNKLTTLIAPNSISRMYCHGNQLAGESMDALIESLPETEEGWLHVYDEGSWSEEGNVITKSQVATAKAKGWTPYYTINGWEWYEYDGSDDTATSIALPEIENGSAAIYTLHGQKVTTPQKGGIYVIGGKKVVVK